MNSPLTVVGMAIGAVVAGQALSWLLGANSSSSNALSSGSGPDLGGAPPPPALNQAQTGGAIPHATPFGGSHVPGLNEILRNAGYSDAEQQQLVAEAEPLPPCPEDVVFVTPSDNLGNPDKPSETRKILTNGEASNYCSGEAPSTSFQPVTRNAPKYLCRDKATKEAKTSCSIPDPNASCPEGQELEQCSGLRQSEWASAAAFVCSRAKELGKKPTIVLEETGLPEARGQAPTPEDMLRFDEQIRRHCPEDISIYSEDPPFAGASRYAQDRVQFRARPEDILQGRNRARSAEPQPDTAPEAPVQNDGSTHSEANRQGTTPDYNRLGARPKDKSSPRKPMR
ncbi:MAG: hypothetical protein ACRDAP_03345 [Shewanella sp.]